MSERAFESVECSVCGCVFQLSAQFHGHRVEDGHTFFCPNGHGQCFRRPAKTDADKEGPLKEEKARHQRTLERLNEATEKEAKLKSERGIWPFRLLKGERND